MIFKIGRAYNIKLNWLMAIMEKITYIAGLNNRLY